MGKNGKIFAIIYITILAILSIPILYLSYINITKTKELNEDNNKLVIEYEEILKQNKELNITKEERNKEYENIQNLEEKLKQKKEQVFLLASKVEKEITEKKSNKKIAYLTFDDGPYYNTTNILKTLKEKEVKATFFTIGQSEYGCQDKPGTKCIGQFKKIVDAGHTIANHTYSHALRGSLYQSVDNFKKQIKKQQDLIEKQTGAITNIMRFPGGSSQPNYVVRGMATKLKEALKTINYGYVDWTAQNGDGGDIRDESKAWSNFTGSINEPIEVVLLHDYNYITTKTLPKMIDYLREKNYILLPLFYESIKVNK